MIRSQTRKRSRGVSFCVLSAGVSATRAAGYRSVDGWAVPDGLGQAGATR
jgi:hypothetical protein